MVRGSPYPSSIYPSIFSFIVSSSFTCFSPDPVESNQSIQIAASFNYSAIRCALSLKYAAALLNAHIRTLYHILSSNRVLTAKANAIFSTSLYPSHPSF